MKMEEIQCECGNKYPKGTRYCLRCGRVIQTLEENIISKKGQDNIEGKLQTSNINPSTLTEPYEFGSNKTIGKAAYLILIIFIIGLFLANNSELLYKMIGWGLLGITFVFIISINDTSKRIIYDDHRITIGGLFFRKTISISDLEKIKLETRLYHSNEERIQINNFKFTFFLRSQFNKITKFPLFIIVSIGLKSIEDDLFINFKELYGEPHVNQEGKKMLHEWTFR